MYLIIDNSIIDNITKIVQKINPLFVFALQMFIPMFKPLECKINVDNMEICELFLNKKKIDLDKFFSSTMSTSMDTNVNFMEQFNLLSKNLSNKQDILNENVNKTESLSVSGDLNKEIDNKIESLLNGLNDIGNNDFISGSTSNYGQETGIYSDIFKQLGGIDIDSLSNLLNIKENSSSTEENNNILKKIGNIWTTDYYENENLDDFLIDEDENNKMENMENKTLDVTDDDLDEINLTKYLKLNLDEILVEINLCNLNNYDKLKQFIKVFMSKIIYEKQTKIFESDKKTSFDDIMNFNKCVKTDSDGEKYIEYKIGENSESKTFKYKHFEQLKNILLELLNFIENM